MLDCVCKRGSRVKYDDTALIGVSHIGHSLVSGCNLLDCRIALHGHGGEVDYRQGVPRHVGTLDLFDLGLPGLLVERLDSEVSPFAGRVQQRGCSPFNGDLFSGLDRPDVERPVSLLFVYAPAEELAVRGQADRRD